MPRKIGGYGWRPSLPDMRDHRYAAPASVLTTMPSMVDLRTVSNTAGVLCLPPVYQQDDWGSCTANGIGAALVYVSVLQGEPSFMPSRMFLYFNERQAEGDVGSDSGAEIRDGVASVCRIGVCEEGLWPYDAAHFSTPPTVECYQAAAVHRATRYLRVSQTLTELKGCLAHGFPIVAGMTCYDSFESAEVARTGLVPMPGMGERVSGGHCVLIVGYDDARGMFLCRNSWGTAWGQQGYFWLPYAFVLDRGLCDDLWTIRAAA